MQSHATAAFEESPGLLEQANRGGRIEIRHRRGQRGPGIRGDAAGAQREFRGQRQRALLDRRGLFEALQ